MLFLKKISILTDNYVWILVNSISECIIIDPGCAKSVIKEVKKKKWHPIAILLTHNHVDHVSGVKKILQYYPKITVLDQKKPKKITLIKF